MIPITKNVSSEITKIKLVEDAESDLIAENRKKYLINFVKDTLNLPATAEILNKLNAGFLESWLPENFKFQELRQNNDLFQNLSRKTQKLIHTKKNLRLYMETKDSEGIRHLNIDDIDQAERDIRPKKAVITKISKSGDEWLQNNLGIDVKH